MTQKREPHTRRELLFRKTKALCREHGLQAVTDAFPQRDGLLLMKLECGCRRSETQP
jgi:hypothetical protein